MRASFQRRVGRPCSGWSLGRFTARNWQTLPAGAVAFLLPFETLISRVHRAPLVLSTSLELICLSLPLSLSVADFTNLLKVTLLREWPSQNLNTGHYSSRSVIVIALQWGQKAINSTVTLNPMTTL